MVLQIFIALATFVSVIKFSGVFNWRPVTSAIITVLVPTTFSTLIQYIYISGNNLPLFQALTVQDGIITFLQLIVAIIVFYVLDRYEDSFDAWLTIAVLGGFAITVFLPFILRIVVLG